MSESKFKTMRHIETVRNYINKVINELIRRAEHHDQSKLQTPEVEIFEIYTPKLRGCTYGSDEYKQYIKEMEIAIKHHNANNSHHPEHFCNGIAGMNLFDIMEMLCDWKAATMRQNDGNIIKSIEINYKRFGFSDELKSILINTVNAIETWEVYHHAQES